MRYVFIMIKKLFKYFLKGLLIVAPFIIVSYIIIGFASFLKKLFPSFPTLYTFFIVIILTIVVGFLFSSKLAKDINTGIKKVLKKFPLVYHIYTSVNKLVTSFVGKDSIFENPVWVDLGNDRRKIGFVTRENMKEFELNEHAAVYFPDSFSLSGETIIIPKNQISEIQAKKEGAFALAISGGMKIKENE